MSICNLLKKAGGCHQQRKSHAGRLDVGAADGEYDGGLVVSFRVGGHSSLATRCISTWARLAPYR